MELDGAGGEAVELRRFVLGRKHVLVQRPELLADFRELRLGGRRHAAGALRAAATQLAAATRLAALGGAGATSQC